MTEEPEIRCLFAKASCADNIARARELLAGPKPQREPADADVTGPNDPSTPCPCCGGRMIIIETFARNCQPPEFELEKARNGLAMPHVERAWQLEAQIREARHRVRMRKAQQMAAKLRLKLSK